MQENAHQYQSYQDCQSCEGMADFMPKIMVALKPVTEILP
jgi:hypothetical protein